MKGFVSPPPEEWIHSQEEAVTSSAEEEPSFSLTAEKPSKGPHLGTSPAGHRGGSNYLLCERIAPLQQTGGI